MDEDLNEPLYRVVCAANRHKTNGIIICGARHLDDRMRAVIMFICGTIKVARENEFYSMEQGFIDNKGQFLTREQAWIVAEKAGQIRPHPSVRPGALHSEDLY